MGHRGPKKIFQHTFSTHTRGREMREQKGVNIWEDVGWEIFKIDKGMQRHGSSGKLSG